MRFCGLRHVAAALLAAAATADDDASEWKVERIADAPALPQEIPEPFRKLLDPAGLRLLGKDAKPLCELWRCKDLPLLPKSPPSTDVRQSRLAPGLLVGAMRTFGATSDYRDQPIAAGVYGLRYFRQPVDGNHLGTADSRDFLVVTSFESDLDPKLIEKQDDLVALSVPVSPTDHALVLYVAEPPVEPAKDGAPRFFRRGERKEWAVELVLTGPAAGGNEPEQVRLGLVLVGHVAG